MPHLRPLEADDLARVDAIFTAAFDVSPPKPLEYVDNLRTTEPEGCFVAEVDGGVVGYAFAHRSGRVGYLGSIAVDPEHRGKGLGKALTLAVADHLAARCDVVGLAVDPKNARNLSLYTACGFEAERPSSVFYRPLAPDRDRSVPPGVRSAAQLGPVVPELIAAVARWSHEVLPGLDCTRDLELFAARYPARLWFVFDGDEPRGVMGYHDLFRGDPWGLVRPGAGDARYLEQLITAVEAANDDQHQWVQFNANFDRLPGLLTARGYRCIAHNSAMVLAGHAPHWPRSSDALLIRPWWT